MKPLNVQKLAAACVVGVSALLAQHGAIAASVTKTFTNRAGQTFSETRTATYDRSTRTTTHTDSLTGPQGRTASQSVTQTPDGRGGLTVTRSVTGFNGQTHTSSHTVGR